jgi:hypothetical protein
MSRPSLPRYRSPRFLAKLVTGAFAIYAAACAWAIWVLSTGVSIIDDLQAGKDVAERHDAWSTNLDLFEVKLFAFQLLGVIVFCVWTYRVTANVRSWGLPGEAPAWAVGSYFVPFLNLWMPYSILSGVWIASESPGPGGPGLRGHGASLVLAWWLLWTASRIGGRVATQAMSNADGLAGASSSMSTAIAMLVLELLALLLMLAVVWGLTHRQEQRQAGALPLARVFA